MAYYGKKETDPFYSTGRWKSVRELALQRDLGLCQDCLSEYNRGERDDVRAATMVHHLRPIRVCWDRRYDLDNLISLCDRHHEARHPERHGQQTDPNPGHRVRVIRITG